MPSQEEATRAEEPLMSESEWRGAIFSESKKIDAQIGGYTTNPSFPQALALLRPFVDLGVMIYKRRPKNIKPDFGALVDNFYSTAVDQVVGCLLPAGEEIDQFAIPETLDASAWETQTRSHFGATIDLHKQLSNVTTLSPDVRRTALLSAMHFARLWQLVFARVPQGKETLAGTYQKFCLETSDEYLSRLQKLGAITEKAPAEMKLPEPVSPPPPKETSAFRRVSEQIGNMAQPGKVIEGLVMDLPESMFSPDSTSGARTEHKGGHTGEGVRQRFRSLFLSPLDATHSLLNGSSAAQLESARHAVALRKGIAELVGLAFLRGNVAETLVESIAFSENMSRMDFRESLAGLQSHVMQCAKGERHVLSQLSVTLLRKAVHAIASYELDATRTKQDRFFGIPAMLEHAQDGDTATLRFMNFLNEVFRDKTAREKLDLEQLLSQ